MSENLTKALKINKLTLNTTLKSISVVYTHSYILKKFDHLGQWQKVFGIKDLEHISNLKLHGSQWK